MNAVVRSVTTLDDFENVESYTSPDPLNDAVWLRLMIGPADGAGEESFDVLVCTSLWLSDRVQRYGPLLGRDQLIVGTLDLRVAVAFLRDAVASVEGKDWSAIADQLSRLARWEFETYQPTVGTVHDGQPDD